MVSGGLLYETQQQATLGSFNLSVHTIKTVKWNKKNAAEDNTHAFSCSKVLASAIGSGM
jgi:hypothetical protein